MDPSALRVPSPSSSPLPYSYTSISSDSSSTSAASSSALSVSNVSPSSTAASSFSSYSLGILDSSTILICISFSILLCPTACVSPSIPSSRPAHSCRLPHAVFAWYSASLITSLAISRRSVYPITTGSTPGILSSTNRQHAISAR